MIVRETERHFVMTTQHEHARFAGEVARGFRENLFIGRKYVQDVLLAIREHDRAWIRLDDAPIWNDGDAVPFSFTDYPLLPKLVMYRLGLDEVEELNGYAALLCSLHYASFHHVRTSQLRDCIDFIRHETERQKRLKAQLGNPPEAVVAAHYQLLKLCDRISLYVCLNEPGVSKDAEHPWYKDGLNIAIDQQDVKARWISSNEILIRPGLFAHDTAATIKSKAVPKDFIKRVGLQEAWRQTNEYEWEVKFRVDG